MESETIDLCDSDSEHSFLSSPCTKLLSTKFNDIVPVTKSEVELLEYVEGNDDDLSSDHDIFQGNKNELLMENIPAEVIDIEALIGNDPSKSANFSSKYSKCGTHGRVSSNYRLNHVETLLSSDDEDRILSHSLKTNKAETLFKENKQDKLCKNSQQLAKTTDNLSNEDNMIAKSKSVKYVDVPIISATHHNSDTDDDSILSSSPFEAQLSRKNLSDQLIDFSNLSNINSKRKRSVKKVTNISSRHDIATTHTSLYNNSSKRNKDLIVSHSSKNKSADDDVNKVFETAREIGYDWNIVLLIDGNERKLVKKGKSQLDILKAIRQAGLHAEIGLSTVASTCNTDRTRKFLPVGDYMMIARKINIISGQIVGDDKILNFIVERKHVVDLVSSITASPKGTFKPLSRMEQQMRKLKYCGIQNPIILIEGNEDHHTSINEVRKKAVKSFREHLHDDEIFPDFSCVETLHVDGTIKYLINEIREMTNRFRDSRESVFAKVATFCDLKQRVEETMKDQTFCYYLGLRSLPAIGEKKAIAVINHAVTVAALFEICNSDNCLETLSELKTKSGKGGRKLGMGTATDIRDWCYQNWTRINSLHHVLHALPFQSPSINKEKSSVIINTPSRS